MRKGATAMMRAAGAVALGLAFVASAAWAQSDVVDSLDEGVRIDVASDVTVSTSSLDAPVPWYERFTYAGGRARLSGEQRFTANFGDGAVWSPTKRFGLAFSMENREESDLSGFQIDGVSARALYRLSPNISFGGVIEQPIGRAGEFDLERVSIGEWIGEETEIKLETGIKF